MFKLLAAVHNAVMQTFSIVVSVNVWSLVTDHVEAHGMGATYCDAEGSLWDAGFGSWSTVWYLSSYYQFIDAWIMVLKGKQIPDMLLYHHAFMIVILWGGIVTHSSWLPAIVLLSSISQITNYTEHFIKSMLPSMESRGVHFLATIKFLQFITIFFTWYHTTIHDFLQQRRIRTEFIRDAYCLPIGFQMVSS